MIEEPTGPRNHLSIKQNLIIFKTAIDEYLKKIENDPNTTYNLNLDII